MKAILTLVYFLSIFPSVAEAQENQEFFYHVRDSHTMAQVSKRTALLILLNNSEQTVVKCVPQEVSDKATLVNRKAKK
jgi:hypothetical protein